MRQTVNSIAKNQTARQFVKFGIVGTTSTAIDWGLHALLYKGFGGSLAIRVKDWLDTAAPFLRDPDFDGAFTLFKALSFAVATLNGFYWNRRWTWRIRGMEQRGWQLVRFYVVNIIGLGINTFVASRIHSPNAGTFNYVFALAAATIVTMFWNFSGHKFWTFRQRPAKTGDA